MLNMKAMDIINAIQKEVPLSIRERNWIKDNTVKRDLQIDSDNFFIDLSEIKSMDPRHYLIIQNGKSRKLRKFDTDKHAIIVINLNCCRVFKPKQ